MEVGVDPHLQAFITIQSVSTTHHHPCIFYIFEKCPVVSHDLPIKNLHLQGIPLFSHGFPSHQRATAPRPSGTFGQLQGQQQRHAAADPMTDALPRRFILQVTFHLGASRGQRGGILNGGFEWSEHE